MKNIDIRFVNGLRLSVSYRRLSDGHYWNVIIGVKEGKKYMFSRHMCYENAVWRMNAIDPDSSQYAPFDQ